MRRFLHRLRGIRPSEDVYLIDVTEPGEHAYWAFTEPSWYEWAATGGGPPPPSLVKTSPGDPLPPDPTPDNRVNYVVGGALVEGAFVGRTPADVDEWLAGRTPLGWLHSRDVGAGRPTGDGTPGPETG